MKKTVQRYLKQNPHLTRKDQEQISMDILGISRHEYHIALKVDSLRRRLRAELPNDKKGVELERDVRKEYNYGMIHDFA